MRRSCQPSSRGRTRTLTSRTTSRTPRPAQPAHVCIACMACDAPCNLGVRRSGRDTHTISERTLELTIRVTWGGVRGAPQVRDPAVAANRRDCRRRHRHLRPRLRVPLVLPRTVRRTTYSVHRSTPIASPLMLPTHTRSGPPALQLRFFVRKSGRADVPGCGRFGGGVDGWVTAATERNSASGQAHLRTAEPPGVPAVPGVGSGCSSGSAKSAL